MTKAISVEDGPDEGLWIALLNYREMISRDPDVGMPSRNGPIVEFPNPVLTTFHRPIQRVSLSPVRDANPFFHLFESFWMLQGCNDVEFPAHFAGNIRNYAEDDGILHGAYGHRWRNHFGKDQLDWAITELVENPDSRRVVVSMWDANVDVPNFAKDHPCNLQCMFRVRANGSLDLTVSNRSNDAVWGLFGANAVHFSFLLEYMSASTGYEMGKMYFTSNSLHIYTEAEVVQRCLRGMKDAPQDYGTQSRKGEDSMPCVSIRLMQDFEEPWMVDQDIDMLMKLPLGGSADVAKFNTVFFREIVQTMWNAHGLYKEDRIEEALMVLDTMQDSMFLENDWLRAGQMWLDRRLANKSKKG